MIYYFAYGSNMDQEQMKERCPDSKIIGKAVLKDYKIAFTIFSTKRNCGCADIINSINDEVWGILYEVSENDINNLDKAEVHPIKYRRFLTTVEDELGNEYKSEVYKVVTREGDFLKPSKHYLGLMINAAKVFDFPETYQRIIGEVETND